MTAAPTWPGGTRALLWLLLGLCGVMGFTAHGYVENTDGEVTMHAAIAWARRGSPGLQAAGEDTWPAERLIASAGLNGMAGVDGRHQIWFPIGHQLLLVPVAWLGDRLATAFPGPERALEARKGEVFGQFFWTRFLASFVPALAAAGAALLLLRIALRFADGRRAALLAAGAAVFATPLWPGSSEALSDMPGAMFLLLAVDRAFAVVYQDGGRRHALVAGLAGGVAVLLRYPHALPVVVLGVAIAVAGWRRRRLSLPVIFAVGGLPFASFLLLANHLRFGSAFETGYSAGANAAYFSFSPLYGLPLLLLAPGKGILWFAPPLWLVPTALRGLPWLRGPLLPALVVLVGTLLVWSFTGGWAAGQCWGNRYLTVHVALVVAVALACARPWRTRPVLVAALVGLGLLFQLGGVLTPYRGQQQLAIEAAKALYAEELAAGAFPVAEIPDRVVNVEPRFSPLHTHWLYAWQSAAGRLEGERVPAATAAIFGVEPAPETRLAHAEDRGFGHWWWVLLDRFHGVPGWLTAVPWLLLTALGLALGLRPWLRPAADDPRSGQDARQGGHHRRGPGTRQPSW